MKVVVTGAAGLVGQNLVPRLLARGHEIIGIDKHPANTRILADMHPTITTVLADLAQDGDWQSALDGADVVVVGHAQIGGLVEDEFIRNNIHATEKLIEAIKARGLGCRLVHISSSVVNSAAVDWYTETKKKQEAYVLASGLPTVVLRPTLMFGWFDRKHLGWLARFMQKAPVFPIPGTGRYLRQPLYEGDFCDIIAACIERDFSGNIYNISGQERIDYIDLIRLIKDVTQARTRILTIPVPLFALLLRTYALVDRNPPFTVKQLKALTTPDVFEVIDWPAIFGVRATPLRQAMEETFRDPRYSSVVLEF
ncbi:NAD-dependent epimerase/dehydratase family protein [Ancylobacter pratisalsi]|uniref:NAD-dependent epimerase/dehydratase family protein n=1 Tax=Ancylobacter pratisalsi TaxID=1745854 RepID=A0A6P1YUR1_9HYPH|nr:NAD-dependent epimerase/dehydratase family protein [Ancylobacter pratisalsi]QIB35833.1 NAD-dependent epimerase/dehydratase family protein [Ancylobacter pratisalsi]